MKPAKLFVSTLLISSLLLPAACSKKDDDQAGSTSGRGALSSSSIPVNPSDPLTLANTLATAVPDSAFGVFHWNLSSPAYERYKSSPWSRKNALNFSPENFEALDEVLKTSRIDINQLSNTFTESVFFALPSVGNQAGKNPVIGIIATAKNEQVLTSKVDALKSALTKKGIVVTEKAIEGVKSMRFNPGPLLQAAEASPGSPQEPAPTAPDLIVAWTSNTAIVGSEESAISEVVKKSKARALPPALVSPELAQLSAGISQDRFGTGYASVEQIMKLAATPEAQKVPATAALFAFSMTEAPETVVRVGLKPRSEKEKQILSSLGSTTPATLLSVAPAEPLIFLSLEAKAIRAAQELSEESVAAAPPQPSAGDSQLAMLNSVNRLALSARLAPVGQSILPLPDILIVAESEEAQKLLTEVTAMASGMIGGGPQMAWQDKQVNGVTVKSLSTGMGVSVSATVQGKNLIVSSSDAMMQDALTKLKKTGGRFSDSLSAGTKVVLAEEKNVGSVLVDFNQMGTFLEGIGGMLSMYAPPNSAGNKLTSPETLAELKQMGTLVGSLKVSPEVLEIRSFYEQKAPAGVN